MDIGLYKLVILYKDSCYIELGGIVVRLLFSANISEGILFEKRLDSWHGLTKGTNMKVIILILVLNDKNIFIRTKDKGQRYYKNKTHQPGQLLFNYLSLKSIPDL